MNKHIVICICAFAGMTGAASAAHAAPILLTEASVVGNSGSFAGPYGAANIVDRQTGAITEVFGNNEYWLNPDGRVPAFITIDLGEAYRLGSFDLFNSRNLGDRGTKDFEIYASNTTAAASGTGATGLTLGSDAKRMAGGTLTMDSGLYDVSAQSFAAVDDGLTYRYIQFRPLSAISSSYGGAAYGLNELRVFEYVAEVGAVPEPSTWAMMIAGFGMIGAGLRRTRRDDTLATALGRLNSFG